MHHPIEIITGIGEKCREMGEGSEEYGSA